MGLNLPNPLNVVKAVTGRVGEAVEGAASAVGEAKDSAVGAVESIVGSGAQSVQAGIESSVHAGAATVRDGAGAVQSVVQDAASGVRRVVDDAWAAADTALDGYGDVAEWASGAVGAGAEALAGSVAGAGEAVAQSQQRGFERLGDAAGRFLTEAGFEGAGEAARGAASIVGAVNAGAALVAGELGSGLIGNIGGVASASAHVAAAFAKDGPTQAVQALADEAIGPIKPEYAGQIGGLTGLLTSRLGAGDALSVRVDVGAEIGAGAVWGASVNEIGAKAGVELFSGFKPTGGATLSRNAAGKIELALDVVEGVEAGLKGDAGAGAGVATGSVAAKAAAFGEGRGRLTLEFDPANPDDVRRLQAILEPTPERVARSILSPVGEATRSGLALQDAIAHNRKSIEGGLGVGERGEAKANVNLGPIKAELATRGEALIGASRKVNRDGTTEDTFVVRGYLEESAGVNAAGPGLETGTRATYVRSVTIKRDPNGEILGISGEENVGVSNFESGTDKRGVGGGTRAKASAGGQQVSSTTRRDELTGPALDEARRRIKDGDGALTVFSEIRRQPGSHTTTEISTHATQVVAGGKLEGAAVFKGEATARVAAGVSHTEARPVPVGP